MSNPVSELATSVRPGQVNRPDNAPRASDAAARGQQRAEQRASLNSAIVRASEQVSLSSGNEPLALLFRSAIDKLNEYLAPTLGENAIQNAVNQDNTPEGTASRIVALSTGFFEAFKEQHPDEAESDVLQKFMDTIRSGFEQGFADAQSILDGLGVLQGDIADGINRTHDLVLEGYAKFEQNYSSTPPTADSADSAA